MAILISKSNIIFAINAILLLPFANRDLSSDFWSPYLPAPWILTTVIILLYSRLLWNLFLWIRLKLELLKLNYELFKTRQENVRLREEQLQLQDQLIRALNEYNDRLIRRLQEYNEYIHDLNLDDDYYYMDDEHLDNEDLDQADEIEIIYETCTLLY